MVHRSAASAANSKCSIGGAWMGQNSQDRVAGSSSAQGHHHRMGHKNPTRDSFLSAIPKISD